MIDSMYMPKDVMEAKLQNIDMFFDDSRVPAVRAAKDFLNVFDETGKAIWGYLSDKLAIEVSSLSRESVRSALASKGVTEELIDELGRIIDESEFSRFAPSSEKSDMDDIYMDAVNLIKNLEQNL